MGALGNIGYKETEIGLIPEDWEVMRLRDYIKLSKERNKNNIQYPVYTVSNKYGFILSNEFFDKKVYSKNLSTYKIVRKDYIAYNPYRINVGSIALFRKDIGLVSPAYIVFRIYDNKLCPNFLFLLLKTEKYMNEIKRFSMSRGSVRRSLSFKDLSEFKIPLPPLPEQKAIAEVLDKIRNAIEQTEEVIKATKELKKSLMKHLFTYGVVSLDEIDEVKLKETEIGLIPKHWEVVKIKDVFEFTKKPRNLKINEYDLLPFISMESISENEIKIKKIIWKNFKEITSGSFVFKGDLIIAKITPSFENGKQSILSNLPTDFGYATTEIYALHPRDINKVINEILYFYLKISEVRQCLASKMEGSTGRQRLPKHVLENLQIPLPPIDEQKQIVEILSSVDKKIEAEKNKKQALEQLFKTLLNNLMSGKIRLDKNFIKKFEEK